METQLDGLLSFGSHFSCIYYGTNGVDQRMDVLKALQRILALDASGPLTSSTGRSSTGDASAGRVFDEKDMTIRYSDITAKDDAGAAILTAVVVGLVIPAVYMLFHSFGAPIVFRL